MSARADFNNSKCYHLTDYVNSIPRVGKDPVIHAALIQLRIAELAILARLDELDDSDGEDN